MTAQLADRGPSASMPLGEGVMGLLERPINAFIIVGALYYAGAMLGLKLIIQPENVAVFWPASGIAAGILASLGRPLRLPVAAAVLAATVAANLVSQERNLPLALAFGLCNAGEALLFAWLIERRFKLPFDFADLAATMWFLISAAVAAAVAAMPATASLVLIANAGAAPHNIWKAWWASDAIGIIMFAPLFITLGAAWRTPHWSHDLPDGLSALAALVLAAALTYCMPPAMARWWAPLPVATLFPLLLWLSVRCRPSYPAAGLLCVALIVVWATNNGLGHFGDKAISVGERVFAAQLTLIAIAFCGLTMLAAFNKSRQVEADLRAQQERFDKLGASSPGLIYTFRIDKSGRYTMPYASSAIGTTLGVDAEAVARDGMIPFRHVHAADIGWVNESVAHSRNRLEPWHAEFRYIHPERGEIWLEGYSAPVREPDGAVMWHGIVQDITKRKTAETNVAMLMGEVNHRANNLLSVLQAIVINTLKETDQKQFLAAFDKRIKGLARSHSLLMTSNWEGVMLADLIVRQIETFGSFAGTRILFEGPPLLLAPPAAQSIGMAVHELATNAIKYGALSVDQGTVRIAWSIEADTFRMGWIERGGPPATPPARSGFGHQVMVKMAEHQLDASVGLTYPTSGLEWRLEAPADRILAVPRSAGESKQGQAGAAGAGAGATHADSDRRG